MTKPPSILIVDDEEENLDLLRRTLSERFDVETAPNGEKALEAIRERPFSVIVSDHRMPGMSGVDLLHRVCQISPDTVRILVTGYADVDTAANAINEGRVSSFLRKPLDITKLIDEVDRCLTYYRLVIENRALTQDLSQKNDQLAEAKRLLEMDLDARTRDLVEANKRLEELVVRDSLTGLYNHRYFQERSDQEVAAALRHGHPLSLIFCDVDHFKAYNDNNGHPAGDRLLIELSRLLLGQIGGEDIVAVVRETDIIARYGGEEFVVLLPKTPREGAAIVAERIRKAIYDAPFPNRESQPLGHVTVSLGVAECPRDARSKSELVRRADTALFQAKSAGRNCVRYFDALDALGKAPELTDSGKAGIKVEELEVRIVRLQRAVDRERQMRQEVENLLEEKTRDLYLTNESLRDQQAARIQAEKLSALGRLSAGLAHEINNALNFITGNLQHLNRYLKIYSDVMVAYRGAVSQDEALTATLAKIEKDLRLPLVEKDMPKLVNAMNLGAERAASIVRDMDVFAQPEAQIRAQPIDLKDPLELALAMSANRLKYKTKVSKELAEVPRVVCHHGKISQVFLNLLLNAADSIEQQGEIVVAMFVKDKDVVVSIRDSGSGIKPADQGRLFEPFFTTKDPGKGTGLGLHMCLSIVKEHEGKIWFESDLGVGTTFFVSLPIEGRTPSKQES